MNSQEARMRECLEIERGKALVKGEITPTLWSGQGRPEIARDYSNSIVNFALRVFLNREENFYGEANDALYENAHYYRTHKAVRDDRDSYYWALGEEVRILLHYGRYGDRCLGLLREDTETEMVRMMAEYNQDNCSILFFEYEKSRTWKIHESENHHMQRETALWLQAKVMLLYPEIGDVRCADGHLTSEHLNAAVSYFKAWLCERGRKSLFVEVASNGYSYSTLKSVYHIYDFTEDEELRRLAKSLIDLYYATLAQEQFFGSRGGGQGREYPWLWADGMSWGELWRYCTLGLGYPTLPKENDYTMLDSGYRCPELIQELAQSAEERGIYEIFSRPAGLADEENAYPLYSVEKGFGGIVRYSYCTPDYIMGTLHFHRMPCEKWLMISSQNRIQAITFAVDKAARIMPVPWEPFNEENAEARLAEGTSYNTWYSAQKESCLITMDMPKVYAWNWKHMSVWITAAGGLAEHLEQKGEWLFTYSGNAYAAIYVNGSYELMENRMEYCYDKLRPRVAGTRIQCRDANTAVVIEMGRRESYGSYENFCKAVLENPKPVTRENVLYYTSLEKHNFVFGMGKDDVSVVDGQDPAAEISESYKSPFLNGTWGEPEVELRYKGKQLKWNFVCEGGR